MDANGVGNRLRPSLPARSLFYKIGSALGLVSIPVRYCTLPWPRMFLNSGSGPNFLLLLLFALEEASYTRQGDWRAATELLEGVLARPMGEAQLDKIASASIENPVIGRYLDVITRNLSDELLWSVPVGSYIFSTPISRPECLPFEIGNPLRLHECGYPQDLEVFRTMGLLPLNYRRPTYVDKEFRRIGSSNDFDGKTDASLRSGRAGAASGIPDALTFDKIVNGGTCPPCTLRDFMNYLIYIEHSAENLQFFLWYRDYVKRFNEAPISETDLAPEWTKEMEEEVIAKIQKDVATKAKKESELAREMFKGTDFDKTSEVLLENRGDPFSTPPSSSAGDSVSLSGSQITYIGSAGDAFSAAGVKRPFTIQPFRAEINRVIGTYIIDDAPRQLNLSAREQKAVVQALSYTTHPSAFRSLSQVVETALRKQAHPNFIRWAICNGNPARVTFARALGAGSILLATVGSIILTLSSAGRGWRALFAVLWVVGIATLMTAVKGMCVVLHGLHHRHVRPWELFVTDDDDPEMTLGEGKRSFDSFGSSNSYEDEPWVVRYRRRLMIRKIFDREVWIQEPALRQIQDTIFLQSMLAALLGAGILTAVFVAVPAGGFF